MSDSDTEVRPQSEREKKIKEACKLQNERMIISLLKDLLESLNRGDEEEVEADKYSLLENLRRFTYEWQNPPMSGGAGEIATEWLGRGFLQDFPEFKDFSSGEDKDGVECREGEDGKTLLEVKFAFKISDEKYFAKYNFSISREDLIQKDREAKEKLHGVSF